MDKLATFFVKSCKMKPSQVQLATELMRKNNPLHGYSMVAAVIQLSLRNVSMEGALALAIQAYQIYEGHETSLEISKQFSTLMRGGGSSSTSEHPMFFREWGRQALDSPVDDDFPAPADAKKTDYLWPKRVWKSEIQKKKEGSKSGTVSSETALKSLLQKQKKLSLPKYVNFVFIKARGDLCAPKYPDFYLVKKQVVGNSTATPETVGAILFTQSTAGDRNFAEPCPVGEAVLVGKRFLKNAPNRRQLIIVGVTNLTAIQWFKVRRSGKFSQSAATRDVRESFTGFMCSSFDGLGLVEESITVGETNYPLGRWLGEGHTSNVYRVQVNNEEFAVKIPKRGKDVSTDIQYLGKLCGVNGIPAINTLYSTPYNVFMQPVCSKFNRDLLSKKNLGDLVDTLRVAHDRSVVNRDIRTGNMMMAGDVLVIVDWGYAAPLCESVSYCGTTHFASERVLRLLEDGTEVFPFEAADDLESLLKSFNLLRRINLSALNKLIALKKNDYRGIRRFWKDHSERNWTELITLAQNTDYVGLKERIQDWL